MTLNLWQPGMIMTEERLNDAAMIGAALFLANRSTTQAITTGAESAANAVSWTDIELDALGGWSAANPTRWTAPRDGWYKLEGSVGFNGSTAGEIRDAIWFVNGALISMGRARTIASTAISGDPLTIEARAIPRLLAEGDYVELIAAQDSGSSLNTATGSLRPFISITYAGAP